MGTKRRARIWLQRPTGEPWDTLSKDAWETHARWKQRKLNKSGTVDRLTARIVWGSSWGSARGWRTLAIAGPRGPLPG